MNKPWPHKTIIGLTGNIATGKSAVMRLAAQKGALTLDADKVVHEIMDHDPSMQAAIAVAFGSHVRKTDGSIDRPALGEIVFGDPEALRDLEAMMHPAVRQVVIQAIGESEADVVLIEAIKLLEGEMVQMCDQIWVTHCSPRTQIERLMVCRGLDDEAAVLRVKAQNPQEEKVARADVVIDTGGRMADTVRQFEAAWQTLPAMMPADARTNGEMEPAKEEPAAENREVVVRRARPSDIPAILLLIQRATNGAVQMRRSELLMSFSERSYLIGQVGAEITTIIGWNTDSTTAACIDRIYVQPPEAIWVTGPLLLGEIERSAQELICEVTMAFLPHEGPDTVHQVFKDAGFEKREKANLHRAWLKGVEEMQPAGTYIMAKVLRDVRN